MIFLTLFLGFLGLFYFFPDYIQKVPYIDVFLHYTSLYSLKLFTLLFGFFVFKVLGVSLVYPIASSFLKKITPDEDDLDTFKKIFSFIWWFLYFILVLAVLIGFSKLATSIGLIGLGLSLAFQRPILNIVGWFTIVTKQLYKEGDRIEVFAQRSRQMIRGDVKEINLFHTVLDGLYETSESKAGKTVSFPNEFILLSEVRNYCKDSNYILTEIYVNVTIKTNTEKAKDIYEKVIKSVVIKYSKEYLKKIKNERSELDISLKNLLKKAPKKKDPQNIESKEYVEIKKDEIIEKTHELDEEIKKVEELSSELSPKVHISINDEGSIRIIGQYQVPYTLVKKSKTEIYLSFLNKIKSEKDIEIFISKTSNKM
ncbi:MAG: mechanosensitive ion channel [Nanoarchaeota archaeon]|nr:mechanosensitive ion channel [Nanoarchaeota archaeon]